MTRYVRCCRPADPRLIGGVCICSSKARRALDTPFNCFPRSPPGPYSQSVGLKGGSPDGPLDTPSPHFDIVAAAGRNASARPNDAFFLPVPRGVPRLSAHPANPVPDRFRLARSPMGSGSPGRASPKAGVS